MIEPPAISLNVAARFAATIERRRLPLAALYTASGLSLLGRQLATISIPWAIYSATGSPMQTGLAAAGLIFPWLLTDPTGSTIAARIGHKAASISAGILGAATVATIPLFNLAATLPFATMLLVVVLFAAGTALGSASRHTLMPEAADLAGRAVDQACSATQTIARLAILTGTVLAGPGIALLGSDAILTLAATLIAVAAAADLLLSAASISPSVLLQRARCAKVPATSTHRPAGTLDQP